MEATFFYKVIVPASFKLLTGIPRMAQRIFNHPRIKVLRLDTQYPVLIMQVYIPAYNALQVIQVRANVMNMFPVAQIGFKNEDVHI